MSVGSLGTESDVGTMMKVTETLDAMMAELKRAGRAPEHVVMGKNLCMQWLAEQAGSGSGLKLHGVRKFKFTHRGIPVVVCESDILEVVPNPKDMLGGDG